MFSFHSYYSQTIVFSYTSYDFSLTHWLFRTMLFNMQMFLDFPDTFLLLMSSNSIVVREHTPHNLNYFSETCFMTQSSEAASSCEMVATALTSWSPQEGQPTWLCRATSLRDRQQLPLV